MSSSPVEIGSLLAGKYRIERVLGQGGMGIVVVAMHDELDQRVAIKFLHKEALTDADWVTRFAREARAAARIKSEHAVKVYDVGKLENGAPYMVMEYLEGCDIQTILNDKKQLPIPEAVEYLLQACEAIAEAHSVGVVHRDLKPANLFVTYRSDGSPCVKILDFGISKMTSLTGGGRDQQTVTNTTAIVGSPLYMSPEQMRASKNVDRRTDIWSLGVILQELVSGLPAFVANTTAELCALVLTAEPTPLRGVLTTAPAELEAIVGRCLVKNPDKRYSNIAELAKALEPFGPSSVKTSVERITRIVAGSTPQQRAADPEPAPVSIVPLGQSSAHVSSLGQTELSDSGVRHDEPDTLAVPQPVGVGAGTAAAWGSSQAAAKKKSRMPLVVGASALAGLVVVFVAVLVLKSGDTKPATQPPPPPPSAVTTVTVPAAVTTEPATATATVTATAAVTPPSTVKVSHTTTAPSATASAKKPHAAPVDTNGFGGRN